MQKMLVNPVTYIDRRSRFNIYTLYKWIDSHIQIRFHLMFYCEDYIFVPLVEVLIETTIITYPQLKNNCLFC